MPDPDTERRMVIWKHQFPPLLAGGEFNLPRGAKVLHFDQQHGQFCFWEIHTDGETATDRRVFQVLGTGHAATVDPDRHIGTCLVHDGDYVFHLFEVDLWEDPVGG
jgi:hypothetical protein